MGSYTPAGRFAAAIQRRGAPIVLTNVTRSPGPSPLVNPPDLDLINLVVDGAYTAGSSTIGLRTTSSRGVLLFGDRLFFGPSGRGGCTTVTTATPSNGTGFTAVPIMPFARDLADGTPVMPIYQADISTYGMINSFPLRLVDGTRIQSEDLSVTISADNIPAPATSSLVASLATWRVTIAGRAYSIASVTPTYERGNIISFQLQAR